MVENFKFDDENITGKCPECEFNWDKGDALEFLKSEREKLKINFPPIDHPFVGEEPTEEQMQKSAFKSYGWTPEKPVHLSHLTHLTLSDGDLDSTGEITHYMCPNCYIAWDVNSGERTDRYKLMLYKHQEMIDAMRNSSFNNNQE
jgi:hypothetical protein